MRQTLLEEIKQEVTKNPATLPLMMNAIQEGIAGFMRHQKNERDQLANSAVTNLIFLLQRPELEDMGVIHLIHAAFHNFPEGWTDRYSILEDEFWKRFMNAARKDRSDIKDWIRRYCGEEMLKWWEKYVEPEL